MRDYYKRNLPHYQPAGGTYFITFRLTGSLPGRVIRRLKQQRIIKRRQLEEESPETLHQLNEKHFASFDSRLDKYTNGPTWLAKDAVARIVANKMHSLDNHAYTLISYCIMPNHVHLITKLPERDESRSTNNGTIKYPVTDVLRLIKGATARQANKILNRTGKFWQHESYDHLVRNSSELDNIIRYTLNNPVKAGLVHQWNEWKWTYCNEEFLPVR